MKMCKMSNKTIFEKNKNSFLFLSFDFVMKCILQNVFDNNK